MIKARTQGGLSRGVLKTEVGSICKMQEKWVEDKGVVKRKLFSKIESL